MDAKQIYGTGFRFEFLLLKSLFLRTPSTEGSCISNISDVTATWQVQVLDQEQMTLITQLLLINDT